VSRLRLRSKSVSDKSVYELGLERMHYIFKNHDQVHISFSGGKDSTVVLNLALQTARELKMLPLNVFFWDEEAIPPQTQEYVERVRKVKDVKLRWLCVETMQRNSCSRKEPYWYTWDKTCPELWCSQPSKYADRDKTFPRTPIPESNPWMFPNKKEKIAVVLGLRADESLRRLRVILMQSKSKNKLGYLSVDHSAKKTYPHIMRAYPIYDWTTKDVWVAPRKWDWDYNRAYNIMAAAGISPHRQRCAPPYALEPLRGLYQFAICWPELWDKMCRRVPGANTAARYGRSMLYGYSREFKPPEGMSWMEAIDHYCSTHAPEIAKSSRERIEQMIELHKQKTNDPIPDLIAHVSTGTCYQFLLKVAMRGDSKGRMNPTYLPNVAEATKDEEALFSEFDRY